MPKLIPVIHEESRSFSFLEATKQRLISEISRIKQKYQLNNIVLVLDLTSAKILARLINMTELVSYGVMFVERLEVVRKPLDHHAIYFLTPNSSTIQSLLKDFQSQTKSQYRKVHILFTGALDHKLMKSIAENKYFLKRLARHSFKEFYCQLQILAGNCLHMGVPYLAPGYSRDNGTEKNMRGVIGQKLVHIVAAYDKLWAVRLLYPMGTANKVAERVVEQGTRDINAYLNKLLQNKSAALDPHAQDITILVLDRSIDVITPLIHGYSYEALLYDDVLSQQNKDQEYQKLPKQIFDQFRYRHISFALTELPPRLAELSQVLKGKKLEAVELRDKFQLQEDLGAHVTLIMRLWERYQEKQLRELGELELSLATGITEDGKQTSSGELVGQMMAWIRQGKGLTQSQKVRLGLLVLACVKLNKEDYQKLLELYGQSDRQVLINFNALGISYDKNISRSTKNIEKSSMDRARMLLHEREIPSERFSSALEITLPQVIDMLTNGIGQRAKLGQAVAAVVPPGELKPRFNRQKFVVFMSGGLSPNEICSIRRNSSLDSVVLASDMFLSPRELVDGLRKIDILGK